MATDYVWKVEKGSKVDLEERGKLELAKLNQIRT